VFFFCGVNTVFLENLYGFTAAGDLSAVAIVENFKGQAFAAF
jgi:hypothetical protein